MNKNTKNYLIITSIIIISFFFGNMITVAQPGNDSNLLEDVWEYIFGIEDEVDALSDDVMIIESNLDLLERIHELEIRVALLEACGAAEASGFPNPDFDSGWIEWDREVDGTTITVVHGLNTLEYFVYLTGKYDTEDGVPITPPITNPSHFHTWGLGGDWGYNDLSGEMFKQGIYYEAYLNSVKIIRAYDDPYSDYVRVMLWKIPSTN